MADPMKKSNKNTTAVFAAIDRLAREDRLAMATTALISEYAQVSEGVMFRHFISKEAIFKSWIESRTGRLTVALSGMAAGRAGLLRFIADQIASGDTLSLLCCRYGDCTPQRAQLDELRAGVRAELVHRVAELPGLPSGLKVESLVDSLWQALCRAWKDPDGEDARTLGVTLPWEAEAVPVQTFPPAKLVERLALSASGFVFDPVAGNSFTANETGIAVLRMLQDGESEVMEIVKLLGREYEAPVTVLERDVLDFAARLREVLR